MVLYNMTDSHEKFEVEWGFKEKDTSWSYSEHL